MPLYLANCTKHMQQVLFRFPKDLPSQPHRSVTIAPWGQATLPEPAYGWRPAGWRQGSKGDLHDFVDSHLKYGWMDAQNVSRTNQWQGILFSFSKPILEDAIVQVSEANDDRQDQAAYESRKAVAVAASQMAMEEMDGDERPSEFEVTTVEDVPMGTRASDVRNKPRAEEKITVRREGTVIARGRRGK
jgi:hypothetical protein